MAQLKSLRNKVQHVEAIRQRWFQSVFPDVEKDEDDNCKPKLQSKIIILIFLFLLMSDWLHKNNIIYKYGKYFIFNILLWC